jgi:hypothetical protein
MLKIQEHCAAEDFETNKKMRLRATEGAISFLDQTPGVTSIFYINQRFAGIMFKTTLGSDQSLLARW